MSTTITYTPTTGAPTTITPDLVLGFESVRAARTILHDVIGASDLAVTQRPAAKRSGTLSLLFEDETASKQAEDLHAAVGKFALVTDELGTVGMAYVVSGDIKRSLDDSRKLWLLDVNYQEVAP